jgi:hypothetical protein
MQNKRDIYSKSGKMPRSPLNCPDFVQCVYDAMFYHKNDIVYATVSQNTYLYYQTTAHVRMVVHDDVAFVLDTDMYYHENPGIPYTEHGKYLASQWIEPFKPIGVTTLFNQDRSPEAYILTRRIFHNVYKNLEENINLPNDIIGIIKDLDLKNSGLEYIQDPGNPEIWPFKVQHINAFTRHSMYRVVAQSHLVEIDNGNEAWMDLPDIINGVEINEAEMMDEAA